MANITGLVTSHTKGIGVISWNNGNAIKGQLSGANTVTARLLRVADRDGALDAQIVSHEWGHYISNRLIGNGIGLNANYAGGLGEGWGDFTAMLLTVRAEDTGAASNATWNGAYALSTYATSGVPFNGAQNQGYYFGIRRYPYSTDMNINPLTFKHIQNGTALPVGPPVAFGASGANNAEVHNTGEVWANMLWECYASLLRDTQGASPRLTFAEAQTRMKNYIVASYKMTPITPTLLEARDAVLAAAFAYDYQDGLLFTQAFAKRGAGFGAVSPDRFSGTNSPVTESFDAGTGLSYVGATLDDGLTTCDADGYLDNGEKGLLKVTLKNYGYQNLFNTTATVSSANAHVSFPEGTTITFPPSQPGQSVTGSVKVALSGASGIETSDFTIEFQDTQATPATPVTAHFLERVNVDEIPASAATDNLEAKQSTWTTSANQSLQLSGPAAQWNRIQESGSVNHVWFVPDNYASSELFLTSPVFTVNGGGSVNVQFDHSYGFEFDAGGNYDGGVVEVSINGAAFVDLDTSVYNGTILNYAGDLNPLKGRQGFVKNSGGGATPSTVHASLNKAVAPGSTVQVRFRVGSDSSVGAAGWTVENIAFSGVVETPFTTLVAEASSCVVPPPVVTQIQLSPATIPAAVVGTPYTTVITPSGGTGPYTYTVTPTVLPQGFTYSVVSGNLQISGTPSHAGTILFNVKATDSTQQQGNANYLLTIDKADQTITFGALADKTFGDAPFTVSATGGASGNPVTFNSQTTSVCSVSGSTVTILTPGTCTVRASQAGNSDYNAAADVDRSFQIAKAGSTTTVTVSNATYDGNPHGGTATVTGVGGLSQSLTVSYAGRNGTAYGPSATAPTNAGDYTASASYGGDSNHDGSSDSKDFQIAKAAQTITFNALADKTFGDASFAVSATGGASGNPVTFTVSGNCASGGTNGSTITITGAGSCTVTASQAGAGNYNAAADVGRSFNIAKAGSTTTVTVSNAVFDGNPHGGTAAVTGAGGLSQSLTVSYAGRNATVYPSSPTAPTNAGDYTASASFSGDADHDGSSDSKDFQIAKANQTVTFGALADKTFGDAPFNVSATGGASGNAVTFSSQTTSVCTLSGSTVTIQAAGTCTVRASQAGDSNYNAAPDVDRSFTVNKAGQTINFGALADKTFGDAPFAVSATGGASGNAVTFAASGNCAASGTNGATITITGAGSCTVTASQAGSSNYNAAADVARAFQIAKAAASTALSSSVNPSDFGQSVTFTATVTSGAGTPPGSVQFKADGVNLGTAVALNSSGVATLTTSSLATGTRAITADYGGATNFLSGTGTLAGGQVVKGVPVLSVDDVSVTEGDSGTTDAVFTVSLSAASALSVTANFATADGTAAAPGDYQAAGGSLTFAPGETAKTVTVKVKGDITSEPDETFFVTLSSPVNATLGGTATGAGTIRNDDAAGGVVSFSAASYTVAEGAGSLLVTVVRGGDTSAAAGVEYTTDDGSSPGVFVPCSATTGAALARCDFTAAAGRLNFAAGESAKTFPVLVSDDAYAEGPETLHLVLRNPSGGAVLGGASLATLTITDDDFVTSGNSSDIAETFVRQHYHDFLNREPDTSGLQFWTNQITSCGSDAACVEVRRINVSAAFFLSIEHQSTGYLAYRTYVSAFGPTRVGGVVPVTLDEFLPDLRQIGQDVVVGADGWQAQLEANKQAYFLDFVKRAPFTAAFPSSMTPDQFVSQLGDNTGGALSQSERDALVAELTANNTDAGRASVLRKVADDADLRAAELNRAFVLMQYFGYLRRDPNAAPDSDFGGYQFWLLKLNQFGGDFQKAEMVKAFITSIEYRRRFGQ